MANPLRRGHGPWGLICDEGSVLLLPSKMKPQKGGEGSDDDLPILQPVTKVCRSEGAGSTRWGLMTKLISWLEE